MESKFCKICQENHPITVDFWFFFKRPNGTTGTQCKKNKQKKNNEYNNRNKQKLNEKAREEYRLNPSKHIEKRNKNKEKNKEYLKSYREKNKDKIKEANKKWRLENKEYIREKTRISRAPKQRTDEDRRKTREYYQLKYSNDISFRIKTNLRNRLRGALKNRSKEGSAVEFLGGVDEAIKHLESLFHPNPVTGEKMSWENHSKNGWHIDHIIPLSKFNLENPEELRRACHYTNLQPLWAKANITKSNHLNKKVDIVELLGSYGYSPKLINEKDQIYLIRGTTDLFVRILDLKSGGSDPSEIRVIAESNNQRIMQFYATEFAENSDIIVSMIMNFFGQSKKMNARDCQIKSIKNRDAALFFNKNHLMKNHPTSTCFGLYYGDELMSAISFKRRGDGIEISRFATKTGFSIRGGFSKMLSFLSQSVKTKDGNRISEIVSFCDLRYSSGKSYIGSGFELKKIEQGFSWTNGYAIFNRLFCRANMDERMLTESEHAKEMNLVKLYDAGQAKFVKGLK